MFDFKQALVYPFKKDHWKSMLLWPALIYTAFFIIQFIFGLIVSLLFPTATTADIYHPDPTLMSLRMLSQMVLQGLFMPFLFGFYWDLTGTLLTKGMDAPPPQWKNWGVNYWIDGFKILIFSSILSLPYFLSVMAIIALKANIFLMYVPIVIWCVLCFFLTPFIYANFVQALPEKRFVSLFNFPRIFKVGLKYYGKGLLASFLTFLCSLVFLFVLLLSCCTCIGFPVVIVVFYGFYIHIMVQVFEGYEFETTKALS